MLQSGFPGVPLQEANRSLSHPSLLCQSQRTERVQFSQMSSAWSDAGPFGWHKNDRATKSGQSLGVALLMNNLR